MVRGSSRVVDRGAFHDARPAASRVPLVQKEEMLPSDVIVDIVGDPEQKYLFGSFKYTGQALGVRKD